MAKSASLAGVGIAVFFALLPAAAAAGAQGLPLFVSLAGITLLPTLIRRQRAEIAPFFILLLLAFLAWASISSLWSPHQPAWRALKLPALAACGIMFVLGARDAGLSSRVWAFSAAAFWVLAILLAVEAWAGLPFGRAAAPHAEFADLLANPTRGSVVLLGLGWVTAAGFFVLGRRALALASLLAAALLSMQFQMAAAALAFALGAVGFAAGLAAPRRAIFAAAAVLASWMLTAPVLTPALLNHPDFVQTLPASWAHRAAIWNHVCGLIAERPWFGHGLDAGQTASTGRVTVDGLSLEILPIHPHSASLQVWFELGVVGALLASALIGYGGWRLANALRNNRQAAAAAAATLSSYGLIANLSYSAWQEWWLASMLVTATGIVAIKGLTSNQASG